jgi:hypothetical protein
MFLTPEHTREEGEGEKENTKGMNEGEPRGSLYRGWGEKVGESAWSPYVWVW